MHPIQLLARYRRIATFLVYGVLYFTLVSPLEPSYAFDPAHLQMALPENKCTIPPRTSWLESEQWAWIQICEGRKANFNALHHENLDPRIDANPHKWNERSLGRTFLRTILLFEPYRSAIPHRGVFIVGAYFPNGVDLKDSPTSRRLVLERSLFPLPVALDRYSTSSYVRFGESSFHQHFLMVSGSTTDDLLLRNNLFMGPS